LRDLTKPGADAKNPILTELQENFKIEFLRMSKDDDLKLTNVKTIFK
jgi:hypothetical protein